MPGLTITCPYCFGEFQDDQVHFRMETVFTEEELDPKGLGRTREEIETDPDYTNEEIKKQIEEYNIREKFLSCDDEKYEAFWREFGGTTEKSSIGHDGKEPKVMPYQRPVFDPKDEEQKKFFASASDSVSDENSEVYENGMLYAAHDCFGRKTMRRVCPYCHNPLPGAYGKYPVKFISVIGISGAGKTVYLSQLCRYIDKQIDHFGITATPTSVDAHEYIKANPVALGRELPIGTPPEQLLQPLCFDLVYNDGSRENYCTVVFYDIAGENCVNVEKLRGFGNFVEHSDGIILLIDPNQFNESLSKAQPDVVLQTIYNLFQNKGREEVRMLPIAVCISKGDKIAETIMQKRLEDIDYLKDKNGYYIPRFNAADYNEIHEPVKRFVRQNDNTLHTRLRNLYDNYNYFLFSAIGTSVKKIENTDLDTPAGPPIPKRIMEPVAWLLYKYKFIASQGQIYEPKDWECSTCGSRNRGYEKYCPECKTNNSGEWECPNCHTIQQGEWCTTPKCKTNRFGKKKGFLSGVFQIKR